jgi:hypothetical protein
MTDRERLIDLIRKAKKNTKGANCDLEREMLFADYLLSNVIVAPMPMADWLRAELTEYVYNRCLEEL